MSATQTYARAIKNTYEGKEDLKGYKFIASNGNVGVYEKKGQRLFAIRGMKVSDAADRSAVLSLISNKLASSARYKKDKEFILKHKTLGIKNVAVGHSLGGAILDQLIDDGVFTRGTSFNPAMQPKDIKKTANRRLYNKDDFLYLLIGKYSGNHGLIDVDFKAFEGHWLFKLFKLWTAHRIDQFVHRKTDEAPEPEGTTGVPEKKEKEEDPEPEHSKGDYLVQSVHLLKDKFEDVEHAKKWIAEHGYKHSGVDETPHEYRFRQLSPEIIKTGHYRVRSVKIGDAGFLVVLYK